MANPYVINLDSRTDRWERLQSDWRGVFQLTRVPAIQETPGWVGCALSHVKVIEEAKQRGDPMVLVWEDDCKPRNRHPLAIRELWNEVSYKLLMCRDQWDVVLGGTSRAFKSVTYNKGLSTRNVEVYDLPHGFTTHWTLYNSSSYDRMIEWKNVRSPQIDVYLFQKFRVKTIIPFLAGQVPGYSDIEGIERDYDSMFDETETSISATKLQTLSSIVQRSPAVQFPKFMTR